MKPGGQRIKGAAFERKIANILKHIWPDARRGIQYRDGGKEASDIIGTPYHIECSKGGESIWAKWKQAIDDCKIHNHAWKNGVFPIVIKQRDREEPVVMMSLKEWLYLVCQQAWIARNGIALELKYDEQYKKEFGKL